MATQGDPLTDVALVASVESVAPIPMGDLLDIDAYGPVYYVEATVRSNRFPTPPSAFGFLIDVDAQFMFSAMPPATLVLPFKSGILAPIDASVLEPSLGQIWPR